MDIFSTLQEDKSRLSPSESRIAEIIVNDFEFAVNASIIELAERAEVSPPTVTRFCRRLGCESFSDFKVQLARTAHIGVRYLKPESKSTDPADVAQDIITKAQNALFLLHRSLDLAAIEAAVSFIAKADMIYAFGSGGNSSMIADELQNRLFRLGLRITASSDHSMSADRSGAGNSAAGRDRNPCPSRHRMHCRRSSDTCQRRPLFPHSAATAPGPRPNRRRRSPPTEGPLQFRSRTSPDLPQCLKPF